jgi:ribose transport system permease protein
MHASLLSKLSRVIALALICAVLAALTPNFLTLSNLINVLRQASLLAIIAIGMTMTMLIKGIDLSVGSVLALTSCLSAGMLVAGNSIAEMIMGVTVALALGALLGCLNGIAVTTLKLHGFLVTFGMMQIARGLAYLYMQGTVISGFRSEFSFLGGGSVLGVPMPIVIAAVVVLVTHFLLIYTTFGRSVYGFGANESAAKYSGLHLARTTILGYAFSGMMAALAGLLYIARLDTAEAQIGEQFALQAIGAAAIGGISFDGGVGSALGTVVGALIMAVLANGMNLLNVSSLWHTFVTGAAIVLAAIIDRWITTKS